MKFLALSSLAAALLAVLTSLALIAMYFLKLRHRRMMIASSMLWNRVLNRQEERSLWEKLRRILSVVLVVIIGLLMVFAIARPTGESAESTGRIMIVLDTTPSMLARMSDGQTRWQHAVDMATAIVEAGGAGSEFRIADTGGQYDSSYSGSAAEAKQAIRSLRPMAATPRFPEAAPSEAQIYFISDGVTIPSVPPSASKLIVY